MRYEDLDYGCVLEMEIMNFINIEKCMFVNYKYSLNLIGGKKRVGLESLLVFWFV